MDFCVNHAITDCERKIAIKRNQRNAVITFKQIVFGQMFGWLITFRHSGGVHNLT